MTFVPVVHPYNPTKSQGPVGVLLVMGHEKMFRYQNVHFPVDFFSLTGLRHYSQ